jgi:hypothetical protein
VGRAGGEQQGGLRTRRRAHAGQHRAALVPVTARCQRRSGMPHKRAPTAVPTMRRRHHRQIAVVRPPTRLSGRGIGEIAWSRCCSAHGG